MNFKIEYLDIVANDDIKKLPKNIKNIKNRIKTAIESKLVNFPHAFGKPLRRSLKGYRKLRVGDYRIVFRIEEKNVITILIAHRSIAYATAHKRR